MTPKQELPGSAPGGRPSGMAGFVVVWLGQMISVLATNMTAFAQSIYVFEKTGSATALALVQVFFIVPFLILSPVAGVMVDRYNRKLMMMVSDAVAILPTMGLLILSATGGLEIWHFYVAAAFQGIGNTFQWPAYSAAITTMVPKEQLGRANGMMSLLDAGPGVLAPILAGVLLPIVALTGILAIDVLTFFLAILALAIVFVPQPPKTAAGHEAQGSFWKEAAYGFRYIFARPSLLGLQLIFFAGNLFAGIANTLVTPMILARTANNVISLATVQSAGAIAAVIGGIVMSAWGGFKRRVHGVLAGWALSSLGLVVVGVGQVVPVWVVGMAYYALWFALINGSNQAIWQSKVAPDVQGRVFSARRLIAWISNPISPIIAGTMADFVLEPAMKSGGALAQTFGGIFGTGPGSGMGLLIAICGVLASMVGVSGYFISAIRNAETRLPDYGAAASGGCAGRRRHACLIDLVRHVSHNYAGNEQQRKAEERGGLRVQQIIEPALGNELRNHDRDDLVRLPGERQLSDVAQQGLVHEPVRRLEHDQPDPFAPGLPALLQSFSLDRINGHVHGRYVAGQQLGVMKPCKCALVHAADRQDDAVTLRRRRRIKVIEREPGRQVAVMPVDPEEEQHEHRHEDEDHPGALR